MQTDNMQPVDRYLTELTGQIRSKKARSAVEQEIRNHIEDQISAYQEAGMEAEEAVSQTIRQMGDPVSVGIDMDRIHRPRTGWGMIGWILLISVIGLWAQYFFYYRFSDELLLHPSMYAVPFDVFLRQCLFTLTGAAVMILVYMADYSILGKWGRQMGILFLGSLALICKLPLLPRVNGCFSYLKCILYLFVPLYGGILYHYRNTGLCGIGKSLLWLLAAFLTGFQCIGGGLGVTLDMITVCYVLLLVSVRKGWFSQSGKKPLLLTAVLIPAAAAIWQLPRLAPYQLARLQALLYPDDYTKEGSYIIATARTILSRLSLCGTGWRDLMENQQLPMQQLPNVSYDFIMLQIASIGGIRAAAFMILLLGLFYLSLTRMVFRQRNQLGQLAGLGCILMLALETVRSLFNNFGFYTISTGGLPFFSYGKSHTIAIYALLGILLSIYRYQDLAWETACSRSPAEPGVLLKLGSYRLRLEKAETPLQKTKA